MLFLQVDVLKIWPTLKWQPILEPILNNWFQIILDKPKYPKTSLYPVDYSIHESQQTRIPDPNFSFSVWQWYFTK